jgi:hypothetical protein
MRDAARAARVARFAWWHRIRDDRLGIRVSLAVVLGLRIGLLLHAKQALSPDKVLEAIRASK